MFFSLFTLNKNQLRFHVHKRRIRVPRRKLAALEQVLCRTLGQGLFAQEVNQFRLHTNVKGKQHDSWL